ncbi:FAD-dependent oxidoreductase [Streptomyces sp. NPDC047081]|uniref:FAD-dependent oxidoreductase n=1 Tax=Streptomyces sp. NPDC047081 TaxID=3154706 RepID=UPI0033C6A677
MAYVITQPCCNDASCVAVCPVNCIHPAPGETGFGAAEMLYIDPRTCIDCGACTDACPVDAIVPADTLTGPDTVYAQRSAQFYEGRSTEPAWGAPEIPPTLPWGTTPPRVAVVGTGPAACYTAQELLRTTGTEVTMVDRFPMPGGLIRYGVAPDHLRTKQIGDSFAALFRHPRLRMYLDVEVGRHLTHAELTAHHDAVVYAVGAGEARPLGIPGEELPGSITASRFVAWYNGNPEVPADAVDPTRSRRAVVIGNGNVALDAARILASPPDGLARTDIADHAMDALRAADIREVVVIGRRGPADAAYTWPELHALNQLPGVRLVVEDHPDVRTAIAADDAQATLLRDIPIQPVDLAGPPPSAGQERRIVLRFLTSPTELVGTDRVQAVRVTRGDEAADIEAGLVISAIGYRGVPVADLPFDDATGTVPNDAGRVVDPLTGEPVPGTYVAGWIKRGPTGGIGANRQCAQQTVGALVRDAAEARLATPTRTANDFERLVRQRRPQALDRRAADTIDRAERRRGEQSGRPRVKFTTWHDLMEAGRSSPFRTRRTG